MTATRKAMKLLTAKQTPILTRMASSVEQALGADRHLALHCAFPLSFHVLLVRRRRALGSTRSLLFNVSR